MSQNPFATPTTREAYTPRQNVPRTHGTGTFEIGQAVSEAWAATWRDFGTLLGGAIVMGLACTLAFVTIVGIPLLFPVLLWGGHRFLLNYFDGQARIEDLFSGFRQYGTALGGMLLIMLAGFVMHIPAYALSLGGSFLNSSLLSTMGDLLSPITSFVLLVRFYFAPFYVVDQGLGGMDALRASWESTSGQWGMLIVLGLVASFIAFAGVFALLVGLIVSAPLSYLIYVSAYRQVAGAPATVPIRDHRAH